MSRAAWKQQNADKETLRKHRTEIELDLMRTRDALQRLDQIAACSHNANWQYSGGCSMCDLRELERLEDLGTPNRLGDKWPKLGPVWIFLHPEQVSQGFEGWFPGEYMGAQGTHPWKAYRTCSLSPSYFTDKAVAYWLQVHKPEWRMNEQGLMEPRGAQDAVDTQTTAAA
jgi:hypothetical protein